MAMEIKPRRVIPRNEFPREYVMFNPKTGRTCKYYPVTMEYEDGFDDGVFAALDAVRDMLDRVTQDVGEIRRYINGVNEKKGRYHS